MTNHRKRTIDLLLLMASTRLDISHIESYINSMRKIMILIRRSIQKEKSVLRQQPCAMNNIIKFEEKKIYLTHYSNELKMYEMKV